MDVPNTDAAIHEPDPTFVEDTNVTHFMRGHDAENYDELVERMATEVPGVGVSGVEQFWDEFVDYLDVDFYEEYDAVHNGSEGPQLSRWYPDGEIDVVYSTLDRHATVGSGNRSRVACIWEGKGGEAVQRTYHDLYREANRVANVLGSYGVETGDTAGLYVPMVPKVISILYGCFKASVIAILIFSGFGVGATATRLADPECSVLFTADGLHRRSSEVQPESVVDEAIEEAGCVEDVAVYRRFGDGGDESDINMPWTESCDEWRGDVAGTADSECGTKRLPSDTKSTLLYSSGTTGKPKGVAHTHAGVQMQTAREIHFDFDQKSEDRFFWVSDIGWMVGPWTPIGNHTSVGTISMYEGVPDYPNPDRFWGMIEHRRITTFGISPAAIRVLRRYGDEEVEKHDLSGLRLLGSTGKPWDPESWQWFYEHVGGGKAPIINISDGTEICDCFPIPMPTQPLKPCSLDGPGLGMGIDIADSSSESITDNYGRDLLVVHDSCPSTTRSLWEGDDHYLDTYWLSWDGLWDHGDWAQKGKDGSWFLHGHADDALNVAGRKVGPAEVEGALIEHDMVNQAAAVGVPDDTTRTAVVAYVILESGIGESDDLREKLRGVADDELGELFRPREILFVDESPKTQSGKVIRHAIAPIYAGEDLGDMNSIENPESLEKIENVS